MSVYSLAVDCIVPKHGSNLSIKGIADPVQPTDAANMQWVENQVAAAIVAGGAPYEASNGWISGGIVSATVGTSQFDVSAVVCRFVDYTNETAPGDAPIVTLGPWANVASSFPASNAVGINLKSDGTLLQLTDPLNVQTLYGPYIHLGSVIQIGGLIRAVTNSKYPVADRNNLAVTDLVQRFTPLNCSGNVVTASAAATDLSIDVSAGYVWQHMSEVVTNRSEPSSRLKPAVSRPTLARIWRDTGGSLRIEAQNQQLDVNNYNPNGTGGAVQAIPAGYWVNIPIVYSPASDGYAMQYPTATYSTRAYALANVGRFERLDSVMRSFIIFGYVTVQQGATDLTDATFDKGEFFSYNVAQGASSLTADAGDFRSRTVFIDYESGDDTTGMLNLPSAPFKTYDAAVAGITDATTAGQWVVRASGGVHENASMRLFPNTALVGDAPRVANFDVSTDKVALHGNFSLPAYDGAILSLYCNRFVDATPVEIDLYALGSGPGKATSSTFDVREVGFYGDITYRGRTQVMPPPAACDLSFWVNTAAWLNWTLAGGTHYIFTAVMYGTGTERLLLDATNVNTFAQISNLHTKNLYLLGPTVAQSCSVVVSASHIYGEITVDGSGAHLDISRGSLEGATITLLNGGTIDYYDEELTSEQRLAIKNAVPAANSGNLVATEQYVATALAAKVDKTTTVNGNALTGNIVVSASQITTGTLPNAQLSLLATATPASITSNTSGFASSLNGVQTIPADSTMQAAPTLYDDSAKIPTTGWIYDMRGAANGLASLSDGKVPLSELPDSVISGLQFMSTWDIPVDGTEYPPATLSGEFYIVTGSGTMEDTQEYGVGDWFIYDSAVTAWDRVPANIPDLATYTGSTTIHTVGTITQGTWQGTIIDNARGGAGTLSGLLKGNGGAAVTAASTTSDYVAPSGASTLSGEKTFSGGLLSTAALAWTTSSSAVATTSFVQNPQEQIVYVSKVGDDAWDGKSLRNAVKTINQAATLAAAYATASGTSLGPAYQYGILCEDASANTDVIVPEYTAVYAANMRLTGTTMISSYSKLLCRRLDTPSTGNTLLRFKYGSTGAGVAYVSCFRLLPGAIVVDANMGVCNLQTGIIDGLPGTDPTYDVGSGSTLYIQAARISGIITVAAGGILDLVSVAEFGTVSVDPSSAGEIRWPPNGAGNVTGILKCDGAGTVSAAVLGVDYLNANQTITLGSDLSGSGATTLNATITNSAVTLAKMANLASMRLIGNASGSAATPTAVPLDSANTASTVLYRDASSNCRVNHMTEAYTNTNSDITLNVASPKVIEIYGVNPRSVTLPNATTLPIGFAFKILNSSTATTTVYKAGGSTVSRALNYGENAEFICDDNGSSEGSWDVAAANQLITLTGDVTASGRSPIATTMTPIALPKFANIAANTVVANPTGAPAAPTTVPMSITATGGAVCLRDTFANGYFNIAIAGCSSIATAGTNTTLGANATTPGALVFTGTNTQTVTLPDATTLPHGWAVRIFNLSTGSVTVNSATNQPVSVLSGGLSGLYMSSSTANAAGLWAAALASAYPPPLYTNSLSVPGTVLGGTTYTLTPADIYNGPRAFSRNGGTASATLIWPDASVMFAYINSSAGLAYASGPPVGFSWRFSIYCAAQALAPLVGVGVVFFPTTPPSLSTERSWDGTCTVTSPTTYNVHFPRTP